MLALANVYGDGVAASIGAIQITNPTPFAFSIVNSILLSFIMLASMLNTTHASVQQYNFEGLTSSVLLELKTSVCQNAQDACPLEMRTKATRVVASSSSSGLCVGNLPVCCDDSSVYGLLF